MSLKKHSLAGYILGFIISLILTVEAFYLVSHQVFSGWNMAFILLFLAVCQLGVQLFFFVDIGSESKPRLNLISLLFALFVILIVVFGSLWIIKNLSYNHERILSPKQQEQKIIDDELGDR